MDCRRARPGSGSLRRRLPLVFRRRFPRWDFFSSRAKRSTSDRWAARCGRRQPNSRFTSFTVRVIAGPLASLAPQPTSQPLRPPPPLQPPCATYSTQSPRGNGPRGGRSGPRRLRDGRGQPVRRGAREERAGVPESDPPRRKDVRRGCGTGRNSADDDRGEPSRRVWGRATRRPYAAASQSPTPTPHPVGRPVPVAGRPRPRLRADAARRQRRRGDSGGPQTRFPPARRR